MKKILSIILAGALAASVLAGCGGSGSSGGKEIKTIATSADKSEESPEESSQAPEESVSDLGGFDGKDVSYVMIYNPSVYDAGAMISKSVSTGSLAEWIDPDMKRGGEVREESEYSFYDQPGVKELLGEMTVDDSGNRAGAVVPDYSKGDKQDFYYSVTLAENEPVTKGSFECAYSGDNCCMWTLKGETVDEQEAERIAKEFDAKIYGKDVEMFGTPRYADEGGKVHLLFHPMTISTLGYFAPKDIFNSSEIDDLTAAKYGANRDHALIHVNSVYLGKNLDDLVCGTLAHEFQHLINASDMFPYLSRGFSSTWINESMSGYAEETQYPGVKDLEGHYEAFAQSDLIRHGQSLFNFTTDDSDIGVYGSVYLFSEYLSKLGGSDVFKKFHDYWRSSFSTTLTDAEALCNSVGSESAGRISKAVSYPSSVVFTDTNEEWLSKLALDFYLSMLRYDPSDPKAYEKVQAQTLLYDEINPAFIEGGGRIIAATKDGKFEIPGDAGKPLVYIGFDKDFNQVTDIICK